MVRGWLGKEKPGKVLLAALAPYLPDLQKLTPEKAAEWAWVNARVQGDVKSDAVLTPEQKGIREWLEKQTTPGAPLGEGTQLEKFLKAKTIADSGIQYHQLDVFTGKFLPDLLASEPAKAATFLIQLRKLAGAASKTGNSLGYYVNRGLDKALKLRVEALNKRPDAPVALKETGALLQAVMAPDGYPIDFDMVGAHAFYCLKAASLQPDKDGKPQPPSYEKLLAAMEENMDPKAGAMLMADLQDVLVDRNVHKDEALLKELTALSASKPTSWPHQLLALAIESRMRPHHPYIKREAEANAAREARDAARKSGKTDAEIAAMPDPGVIGARPLCEGITDPTKLPASQKALLALGEDGSLPLPLRSGLLFHGVWKDGSIEPAFLLVAARVMAESWSAGNTLDEGELRGILTRLSTWLSQPGVKPPEGVGTVMAQVAGAWRTALRGNLAYRSDGTAGAALLDMAVLLNDDELIGNVITGGMAQARPSWLARLVHAGKLEPAGRLVVAGKDEFVTVAESGIMGDVMDNSQWRYTRALHDRMHLFLASLPSVQHRVFARTLLSGLGDAGDLRREGFPDRKARLEEAAKELAANAPAMSKEMVSKTLMLLGGTEAVDGLAAQVTAAVEGLSLAMLPDARNQAQTAQREALLRMHLRQRLRAGDTAYVQKELVELAKLECDQDYNRDQLLHRIADVLILESNKALGGMDQAAREANRRLWTEVLFAGGNSQYFKTGYSVEPQLRVLHVLMLYALDDRMVDFNKALAAQPEELRLKLRTIVQSEAAIPSSVTGVGSFPWPAEKEKVELTTARSTILSRLIQSSLGIPGYGKEGVRGQWFKTQIKDGWLLNDDALRLSDYYGSKDSAEGFNQGGPAIELAGLYAEIGNKEKALAMLQVATASEVAESVTTQVLDLISRSEVLVRLGKAAEAQQVLESVDPKQLASLQGKGSGERFQRYHRMLAESHITAALPAGPGAVQAVMLAKMKAAPDLVGTWETSVLGGEALAGLFRAQNNPAAAADWEMFCAIMLEAMGRKFETRADDARVIGFLTKYAAAAKAAGSQSRQDFLTLVPAGAVWRYLDDGQVPPLGWNAAAFDATTWPEGKAPLGYGDPGMGTEIKPGGTGPKDHAMSCVMLTAFELADPAGAVESLQVGFRCDDGCVIYLNGKEIARENMGEGEITPGTKALKVINAADEARWHYREALVSALRPGRNVLAVELHQERQDSSDLHGDVTLLGNNRKATDVIHEYLSGKMGAGMKAFIDQIPESFYKRAGG